MSGLETLTDYVCRAPFGLTETDLTRDRAGLTRTHLAVGALLASSGGRRPWKKRATCSGQARIAIHRDHNFVC